MKLRQKIHERYLARNVNKEFQEQLTLGQRMADKVASFGGSWTFISIFAVALFLWMFYQTIIAHNKGFDPYPYILLNLVLSCLAAIQAPVIMMSQNRQVKKDRLQADHDYEINLKAETEVEHIQEELDLIKKTLTLTVEKNLEEIGSLLVQIKQDMSSK
ncbi:hypothetical protein BMS3Abin16_01774 [archaeon BMS3Abin16]|nr:hypothetical protein BMS3Abin16_01774 [archaeon BMS3Abin16]